MKIAAKVKIIVVKKVVTMKREFDAFKIKAKLHKMK